MPTWAVIDLEGTIKSEVRLAGVGIEAIVSGQPCQVLFPRLPPPGVKLSLRDHARFRLRPPDDEGPWSLSGITWGQPSRSYLAPSFLGLRFETAEPRRDIDVYQWRRQLSEWLGVLHDEFPIAVNIDHPIMWMEEEPELAPMDWYEPEELVTIDTWRHAIHHASAGDDAPHELVFAIGAIKAFVHWDHRRVIADAVMACELTLHVVLTKLGVKPSKLKRATFGQMLCIAKDRNVWLPSSERDLLNLRNRVVHTAVSPDRKETRQGLETALELVNHHRPKRAVLTEHCAEHELPSVVSAPSDH